MAGLFKLVYQLRTHCFGGWTLDRWGVIFAWGAAAMLVLRWILRGRSVVSPWLWLVLVLLALIGAGLLTLGIWAARRSYIVFKPEPGRLSSELHTLAPHEKVALWATGGFEVEGRAAIFAGLKAFYRTFATREHAVMAIRHPSRFLLLGNTPAAHIGMWYIFMPAETVEEVTPGRIRFGTADTPALRVVYRRITAARSTDGVAKPIREVVHLMFKDESDRSRVWADLSTGRR